ncbi:MAG: DUF4178 domain-containing protein [Dehalococcoidia bacterium]|nr:DUF4178 domain-containing protein [Dehalococcoidia bacterium]
MPEKTLNCPSCAAPLNIESRFTQLVVCQFCGQTSVVKDSSLDPTGKTAKLTDYASRLRVGYRGKLRGRGFLVLGRVRYRYEDGTWDEWFIRFDDGQPAWLTEDEGEYCLLTKSRLTTPIPPWDQIAVGGRVSIPPRTVFVTEKGSGDVAGAEGELSVAALPGTRLRYIDGNANGQIVRIMFTDSAITLAVGDAYDFHDIVITPA